MVLGSWLALSTVLVALGLGLSAWVFDGPLGQWDLDVTEWLERQRTTTMNDLSGFGSQLADTRTIVIGAGGVAALLLLRFRQEALLVVLAPAIEVTAFLVATFVVDRDRPPVEQLDAAPPTSSFPSGHVAAAFAFYLAAALVAANRLRSPVARLVVCSAAVLVPFWVAWSRLARGMHYPTDVVVGAVAGVVCVLLAVLVVRTVWVVDSGAS